MNLPYLKDIVIRQQYFAIGVIRSRTTQQNTTKVLVYCRESSRAISGRGLLIILSRNALAVGKILQFDDEGSATELRTKPNEQLARRSADDLVVIY